MSKEPRLVERKNRKPTAISFLLTLLFAIGLILIGFEINLYRKTLISWPLIAVIWLLVGLLLTPVTSKALAKHYGTTYFILQVVYNTVTFGGIIIYSFMALNFYLATAKEVVFTARIIKSGSLAKGRHGCGNPFVVVEVADRTKQIVLPCDFEIGDSNLAKLSIRKGLLGFDIIKKTELLKRQYDFNDK